MSNFSFVLESILVFLWQMTCIGRDPYPFLILAAFGVTASTRKITLARFLTSPFDVIAWWTIVVAMLLFCGQRQDEGMSEWVNEWMHEWMYGRRTENKYRLRDSLQHNERKRTMIMISSPICGFRWRHCRHDDQWLLRQSPNTASISSLDGLWRYSWIIELIVDSLFVKSMMTWFEKGRIANFEKRPVVSERKKAEWMCRGASSVGTGTRSRISTSGDWIPCWVNWQIPRSPLLRR